MSEPFIAEIIMFGGNFAPRGWALCDGQLLPIAQNTALFSLLGTTYGGDGETSFGLPELRGRSPVHPGNGPGLSNVILGQKSGNSISTLPTHFHTATSEANAIGPAGNSNDAIGNYWADDAGVSSGTYHTGVGVSTAPMHANAVKTTVQNAGVSPANTNYHPYQAVNFIIALTGVFPSRN